MAEMGGRLADCGLAGRKMRQGQQCRLAGDVMFYEIAEKALALEAKGKKIVRLNVGDTSLPTPECALEAAAREMKRGKSGYGSSAGMPALREAIARREGCGVENVVVGPGSKHLLFGLLMILCKKGGSVAMQSPHYPAYALACRQLGLKIKLAETSLEGRWQLGKVPSADALVVCNPLNPTSTICEKSAVDRAIAKAKESKAAVIVDEAYRGIAFKDIPAPDAIRVRSFSKEFNMENWRLGYAVAPKEVAGKLVEFLQATSTCVAPFVQAAGVACLENEDEILEINREIWKMRMAAASKAMRAAGFEFAEPQAGMYIFATHGGIADAEKYAMKLLERGVAVAPGSAFGNFRSFVRICANQPEDVLEDAIAKMGEAAK